jgi:DNA-binding MarR family transcriptional regulator
MMETQIHSMVRSCACANMRQTDLLISQFYDGILAPSGLYAVQFGLLTIIADVAPISINHLSEIMDMDRVALGRHVKILVDQGLLGYTEGQDRGTSQVILTEEGEQVLERALPLWQEAQQRIELAFGRERFNALLVELQVMRAALNSGAA